MMYRPAITDIVKDDKSYYSLVLGVAKRARDIANEAIDNGTELTEKPVKMAISDLASGKWKIVDKNELPAEELAAETEEATEEEPTTEEEEATSEETAE